MEELKTCLIWDLNTTVWGCDETTVLVKSMSSIADACHDESTYAAYFCWLLWPIMNWDKINPTEDVRPCRRACTLTVSLGGHGASRSLCCPVGQEERKKDMDVILKMQE